MEMEWIYLPFILTRVGVMNMNLVELQNLYMCGYLLVGAQQYT